MKKPHALIGLLAGLGTAIGVLVAVFGLPYGRMNYTAFAGLYHNPGDPSGTPAPAGHLAVDCLPAVGVQSVCDYPLGTLVVQADVVMSDNSASFSVAAAAFTLRNTNSTNLNAPAVVEGTGQDSNPDFDQVANGGGGVIWNCNTLVPDNDTGLGPVGTQESTLDCFLGIGSNPAGSHAMGSDLRIATVTYNVGPGTHSTPLNLVRGIIGDNGGNELVNCVDGIGQCFNGVVNIIPGPTATATTIPPTATNTAIPPTATNTPAGGTVNKIPESCIAPADLDNCDPSIPAANLWICVTGPCAGPGEGNLIVYEYARNITTGDQNGDTVADGLGAYEFSVEYDNFVIQSVNPSDVVFAPLGSIAPYPNGTDGVLDGEGASRAPATCGFSLIFENIVHFGCVTSGPSAGPTGDMDLARLNLIPHPDLTNDIFPGNDNGVVTVLKDNGCELVDVFGHPTQGSVNGGLTPVCGDLAVTVRILEGDLDLDCDVDVADQQLIAFRYGSFFGSLLYSKWYDLEPNLHDLDIDIKDLQKVFGRDGSTCQNPIPGQPPLGPPAPFGN